MSQTRRLRAAIEPLERRVMLTTMHGGDVLEFDAANEERVRVAVFGNTTVEVIGAAVTPFNSFSLVNLPAELNGSPINGGIPVDPPDTAPKHTLFAFYVSQSDSESVISVATVPKPDDDPDAEQGPRLMQPFAGSIGSLRVFDNIEGENIVIGAPSGSGGVLLGAKTLALEGDEESADNPVTTIDVPSGVDFGALPGSISELTSGFIVAPGNDFGAFLFGGTVTGAVDIGGSIDQFYAGWLITGNAGGQSSSVFIEEPNNFTVDGDIRSLIVKGSIGTNSGAALDEPPYVTGFDMSVGGTVGQIRTDDAFTGNVHVVNDPDAPASGFDINQTEIENLTSLEFFSFFDSGILGGDPMFVNDTFETAEHLGAINTSELGNNVIQLDGVLQHTRLIRDFTDYYAVSLMAGQKVQVQLNSFLRVSVGVFDPDGRLVATDRSNNDITETTGQRFQFTADRPGLYRFAVADINDRLFNGVTDPIFFYTEEYQLRITGLGELSVGSLNAHGTVFHIAGEDGFKAQNGDWGGIFSDGNVLSINDNAVVVLHGDLRTIEAGTIGRLFGGNLLTDDVFIDVPNGSVGLLRSTSGILVVQTASPIGGDFQIIDSATNTFVVIEADGGLGTIRAGEIATFGLASSITVNADNSGNDGIIDLIDVAGDLGEISTGGPRLTTNNGGNVRYIRVGGDVFRDADFGGGSPEGTQFDPGEVVTLTDDSGTQMTFTPVGSVEGQNGASQDAALFITSYPIQGGGVAVIDVESTNSVNIATSGGRFAEIGRLDVQGSGGSLIINDPEDVPDDVPAPPDDKFGLSDEDIQKLFDELFNQDDDNGGNPISIVPGGSVLEVDFTGRAKLDVLEIVGGSFDAIRNSTGGEIVGTDVNSIGELSGGTLGIARSNIPGLTLMPLGSVANNTFPFNQQHFGIVVSGSIATVRATGAAGNFDVGESIGDFLAAGGIAGPIVAQEDIFLIDVAGGLLPSGSGDFGRAGIYAGSEVRLVKGTNADIRGDIVARDKIATIQLQNGSIINADILQADDFNMSGGIL